MLNGLLVLFLMMAVTWALHAGKIAHDRRKRDEHWHD
jgi:hypothetical protein